MWLSTEHKKCETCKPPHPPQKKNQKQLSRPSKKRRPGLHMTRPGNKTQRKSGTKNKHVLLPPLVKGSSKILTKEACEGNAWTTPVSASDQLSRRNSIYLPAQGGFHANTRLETLRNAGVRKPACLTLYLLNLSDHCTFCVARYVICKYVKEQTFDPFLYNLNALINA